MKFNEIEWCSPEYQAALELRHRVLREPLGLTLTAEELDGEHGQLHYAMSNQSGQIIAVVVAKPASSKLVQLRQMAVEPDHQRSGVGSDLLRQAEADLASRGFEEIQLDARTLVVGFYERHDYQTIGEPFEKISLEHQKMAKTIAPKA